MKSNELMIGDWIRFFSKYDCGIGKVAGIEPIEGSADPTTFSIIKDKKMLIGVSRNCVEPITITEEILEKNGFVKQSHDYFRYFKPHDENYYFGFESISYFFDKKIAKVTKEHSQSGLQEKVEFVCTHVHELQHAIRLCGIGKEIEP